MAETAASLITDALGEILVSAAEQSVEPVEMSTGIRYLNRMMASFATNGVALGFTVVTSPSSAITVADGAIDGMVANLALRLAPQFDVATTPELIAAAKDGYTAMLKIAVTITPTSFPCTLPIGSGNEQVDSFIGDKFYGCPDDTVLTEEGGNIQLESGT